MGCFFRQNAVFALRRFVFGEFTILLDYAGIVHRNDGVLAVFTIENHFRVPNIVPFQDIKPKQIFVVLWRLHTFVTPCCYPPAFLLQAFDGLFIVWFGVFYVRLPVIAVTVAEIKQIPARMLPIIIAKLIHQIIAAYPNWRENIQVNIFINYIDGWTNSSFNFIVLDKATFTFNDFNFFCLSDILLRLILTGNILLLPNKDTLEFLCTFVQQKLTYTPAGFENRSINRFGSDSTNKER